MQYTEREFLVNKITSGCTVCSFEDKPVLVYEPSPQDKVKAHAIYIHECRNAELLELPTDKEILNQMILRGMWNNILQHELDSIPKSLEELKVELYNAYFQFKQRDNIKKSIDSLRYREVELLQQKDKLKHTTCEGFALSCKNKHLICSGSKNLDGTPFFKDYESCNPVSIDNFIQEYFENKIDDTTIRLISKEEPWRSIWSAGKNERSIFGIPSSLLSYDQRLILIWSKIYDSVYESPECPPEEVIDDNDCFDGWMIVQSRNREAERKDQHGYKPGDKFNKADEVFMFVENPDDVQRVNAMNTPAAIFRKQQRMAALDRSGGKLEDQYMPDAQNKMREQLVQMQRG